jgi:hypothetical protein
MYYVRTDGGIMIAKVDNVVAGMMIRGIEGKWVEKNFDNGKRSVYLFSQDCSYGRSEMKVMIWKGFYITEGE